MKKDSIIDFLGFITVKSFSVCLWCIPLRPALWIGRRMGDAVYCVGLKRRMIAYANLKAAFPEKSPRELRRINKSHFENLGMNVIELLKLPVMAKSYLERHVKLENKDNIKASLEKGKGAIILTAHFGNWEIASLATSLNGYIMSVFAREQKYERLNNLLNEFRQSTGCRVITKGFSAKEIIKTLRNNGIIAMLSDQDAGANGVFVNFFNRPASTAIGPIAFSLKTGAAILPSFIRRVGIDKHIARAGGSLELINTGDKERDMKENLQEIARILEDYIRKFPEQWLWAHKRWKSTPQRSVMVLTDAKAGHLNQAAAVAEMVEKALGSMLEARKIKEKPIVKIKTIEVKFKNKFTKLILNISSIFASKRCQGCLKCLKFCLIKESFEAVRNTYADIVISCGSSAIAANIFLKYENNAKNIIIMKPCLGRDKKMDLIILPRHDAGGKVRRNVLVTELAPNRVDTKTQRHKDTRRGVGILIGGDTKNFKLDRESIDEVINGISKISEEMCLDIFVTTSRRTLSEIDQLVKDKLVDNPHCKLLIIANENNREGVVQDIFNNSDIIIVSPESISMISEAVSSGRHVVIFAAQNAKRKTQNNKYEKNIRNLEEKGYLNTAKPDEIYDRIKEILETRPEIKRLNDNEKIIERLKGIM